MILEPTQRSNMLQRCPLFPQMGKAAHTYSLSRLWILGRHRTCIFIFQSQFLAKYEAFDKYCLMNSPITGPPIFSPEAYKVTGDKDIIIAGFYPCLHWGFSPGQSCPHPRALDSSQGFSQELPEKIGSISFFLIACLPCKKHRLFIHLNMW